MLQCSDRSLAIWTDQQRMKGSLQTGKHASIFYGAVVATALFRSYIASAAPAAGLSRLFGSPQNYTELSHAL